MLDSQIAQASLERILLQQAATLRAQITEASTRLSRVQHRVDTIQKKTQEISMNLSLTLLPELILQGVSTVVADETDIGAAVAQLRDLVPHAQGDLVLLFDGTSDDQITVTAATADAALLPGLEPINTPQADQGATVTFPTSPPSVADAWVLIDAELEKKGLISGGVYRQIISPDGSTTLQVPVHARGDLSLASGNGRRAVSIRRAMPADTPAMAHVEHAAREQLLRVGIDLDQLDTGDFDEDTTWDLAVVAEAGGTIVGMARATIDRNRAIVDQLSVHPAWGRQGIGAALLQALAREARRIGLDRMVGTTFRHVAFNAPFYQRLGGQLVEDDVLLHRKTVERQLGLDTWGDRVVVSFDLSVLGALVVDPAGDGDG